MGKPKIRFKGYNDEWEQRKLGNVLKFQNGFNGSKERYGTGTKLISVMDILNDDFITYESIRGLADVTEEEKERFSVDFGDVLFQRSSENVEDAGRTNVYLDRKRAVFGGFVIRGKKNSDYQPEFMRYVLDTKMIRKQITTKAQGAQHINVSQETLQDVLFCLPSKEEQIRIGNYFRNLDNLITLHQRKYDEMKTLKKYMLQKMFPQNGPKIPKIRFEGFTGEWEQRKLGNVLKFQNGFNGSKERYGTGTKLISVMDILNDDFITYESIRGLADVTEEEKERFSVDFGDVLFQRSSENVEDAGRTNVYLDRKRAVFGGFVIRGKKNSDYQPEFMRYVLDTKMIRKQITTKAQGAQHINVSQETLQDVLFCLPSKEEQIRIGNYFRNLDNLITLHQRKCNELKNIKKFMLQSMFV